MKLTSPILLCLTIFTFFQIHTMELDPAKQSEKERIRKYLEAARAPIYFSPSSLEDIINNTELLSEDPQNDNFEIEVTHPYAGITTISRSRGRIQIGSYGQSAKDFLFSNLVARQMGIRKEESERLYNVLRKCGINPKVAEISHVKATNSVTIKQPFTNSCKEVRYYTDPMSETESRKRFDYAEENDGSCAKNVQVFKITRTNQTYEQMMTFSCVARIPITDPSEPSVLSQKQDKKNNDEMVLGLIQDARKQKNDANEENSPSVACPTLICSASIPPSLKSMGHRSNPPELFEIADLRKVKIVFKGFGNDTLKLEPSENEVLQLQSSCVTNSLALLSLSDLKPVIESTYDKYEGKNVLKITREPALCNSELCTPRDITYHYKLKVPKTQAQIRFDIETENGSLTMNNIEYEELTAHIKHGAIKAKDILAKYRTVLEAGNTINCKNVISPILKALAYKKVKVAQEKALPGFYSLSAPKALVFAPLIDLTVPLNNATLKDQPYGLNHHVEFKDLGAVTLESKSGNVELLFLEKAKNRIP